MWKCGPGTGSISTTWKLVRKASSWAPSQNDWIRNSGGVFHNLCFHKYSREFGCLLKFEKHESILTSQSSFVNSMSLDSYHHPVSVTWMTFTHIWYMAGTQVGRMTQGHTVSFIYLLFISWHVWHLAYKHFISFSCTKADPNLTTFFWKKAYHPCSFKFSKTISYMILSNFSFICSFFDIFKRLWDNWCLFEMSNIWIV